LVKFAALLCIHFSPILKHIKTSLLEIQSKNNH
jgi:hypothetical protein